MQTFDLRRTSQKHLRTFLHENAVMMIVLTDQSYYSICHFMVRRFILTVNKYESNHTGDGKTDGRTRTEVHTGKIHEFVRSNVVTRGLMERRTLISGVIIDTF